MGPDAGADKREAPRTRGLILLTFHNAARELFGGDGLRSIGDGLPPLTRAETLDEVPLSLAWYPTTHLVEWYTAVLGASGAARGEVSRFHSFLHRTTDLGFGRVRRTLLGLFGPDAIVGRAAELWRHDHTTGTIDVVERQPNGVRAILRDHPFLTTQTAQGAISETIRDILSRARGVRRVTAAHTVQNGVLELRYTWE
jgi:hypothetical protein